MGIATPVVFVVVLAMTTALPQVSILEYSNLNVSSSATPAVPASSVTPSSLSPSTDASAASEAETTTASTSDEKDCSDQIGTIQNGVPVNTMPKYDVEKIVEQHGGAAGKLNVTWKTDVPEFPSADDTDNGTFWLYDYRRTDYKTYIRLEHALVRRKGQPDEHVDVRGELYWKPDDFCGKSRHAKYRKDPEGFVADVALEYCDFGENATTLWCAWPASCRSNDTYIACVAAPSSALIASLVG